MHVYEVRPRKDKRGAGLISDALPFGCLWYGEPNAVENAIGYAKHRSRSRDAAIRVYDAAGNVIETHERKGDFKEPCTLSFARITPESLLIAKRQRRPYQPGRVLVYTDAGPAAPKPHQLVRGR